MRGKKGETGNQCFSKWEEKLNYEKEGHFGKVLFKFRGDEEGETK